MPVSGVVIVCRSGCAPAVSQRIAAEEGVEVHGVPDDTTIIAVIEAETVHDEVQIVKRLAETDGVQDVRLAYHNFEDVSAVETEAEP